MLENQRAYFERIQSILATQERALPCLLIDLDILDQNIDVMKSGLKNMQHRIVVKSLPSYELIEYITQKMASKRYMVFHQPFLTDLAGRLDIDADVLMGKPMPYKTVKYFYNNLPTSHKGFNPYRQIQWLVDTEERIQEFIDLAKKSGRTFRINMEIDIGLHRGGFNNKIALRKALQLIADHSDKIVFSGFMGYDPHVVKLPKVLKSQKKAFAESIATYRSFINILKEEFPKLWNDNLTFNGAGSPTVQLHKELDSPINDIASGSCFVKPTTFDIPSLSDYNAAAFIATPVLKKFEGTLLPGIEKTKSILNTVNKKNKQSFFIYGGYWKADYHYPKLVANKLFGESTNQTMVNGAANIKLNVDDFIFLRPHQSEFVFLHFGEILAFRGDAIVDHWSLLKNI